VPNQWVAFPGEASRSWKRQRSFFSGTGFSSLPAQPWASRLIRLIASLGIVVMTVGRSMPGSGRDVIVHGDPIIRLSATWAIEDTIHALLRALQASLHLGRMSLPVQLGFDVAYSVLTLGGLALIPLRWGSLPLQGTALLRWTYAVWLSLLTLRALAGVPAWWQFKSQPPQGPSSATVALKASYLLPGVVVFLLRLVLSAAALARMLRGPLPAMAPTLAPTLAPRTGWLWIARLVLIVGALVWVVGFYLMPGAVTAACSPVIFSVTQVAHGAYAGLDSDQVLVQATYAGLNPIALVLYTVGRNFEFLVAAAGITTLGGWTRQVSAKALAWLALCPALALGVALVDLQGGECGRAGWLRAICRGEQLVRGTRHGRHLRRNWPRRARAGRPLV
jgi:hypothetical protein